MHLVRYQSPGERPVVGVRTGDTVAPVEGVGCFAELLRLTVDELQTAVAKVGEPVPADGVRFLPPLDGRGEVWCAGVTYERSRGARMEESTEQSVYDKVYTADRPELFQKAPAWRVVADGEPIGIRVDSGHDVPEPELAVVVNSHGEIVGFTVCNDMSSRSIEGVNPLYIPQAKLFAGGCALAAGIRPVWEVANPKDLAIDPGHPPRRRQGVHRYDVHREAGPRAAGPDRRAVPAERLPGRRGPGDRHRHRARTGLRAGRGRRHRRSTVAEVGTLTNTVAVGREPFAFLATENLEEKR